MLTSSLTMSNTAIDEVDGVSMTSARFLSFEDNFWKVCPAPSTAFFACPDPQQACRGMRSLTQQIRSLAGHSHYHNVRHRKAAVDLKRHAKHQALCRQIRSALRVGGHDAVHNSRLTRAIEAARRGGMRKETIEKLLKAPAQGAGPVATFEITMPGGVGMLVKARAENKNKVAGELRAIVTRGGGGLAKSRWMFEERVGVYVAGEGLDDVMEAGIEAGAQDVVEVEGGVEILCDNVDEMKKAVLRSCELEDEVVEGFRELRALNFVTGSEQVKDVLEKLDEVDEVEEVVHNVCLEEEG